MSSGGRRKRRIKVAGERGRQKERIGKVVSDKMALTVVVEIKRQFADPLYRKYVRPTKHFVAPVPKGRWRGRDESPRRWKRPTRKGSSPAT